MSIYIYYLSIWFYNPFYSFATFFFSYLIIVWLILYLWNPLKSLGYSLSYNNLLCYVQIVYYHTITKKTFNVCYFQFYDVCPHSDIVSGDVKIDVWLLIADVPCCSTRLCHVTIFFSQIRNPRGTKTPWQHLWVIIHAPLTKEPSRINHLQSAIGIKPSTCENISTTASH